MSVAIAAQPGPAPPLRRPHAGVHLISLLDATDSSLGVFTARNVQYLEELKSIAGDHLSINAMLDRTVMPAPVMRRDAVRGALRLAMPLSTGLALGAGVVMLGGPLAVAGAAVFLGGAVTAAMGGTKDRWATAIGNFFGSWAQKSFAEPEWNGRRIYQIQPDRTPAIDSKNLGAQHEDVSVRDLPEMTNFVRQHVQGDGLKVLWLAGHGITYKFAGGIPLWAQEKMLVEATQGHGPIDLGVYDSCFGDSLENLGSVYPHFRYTIVSGEAIKASVLHESIKAAMASAPNKEWTARELGEAIVARAGPQGPDGAFHVFSKEKRWSGEGCEMLQLIDSDKIPALQDAVGTLGTLLAQEINGGRVAGIVDAVVGTSRYPRVPQLDEMRRKLATGDVKVFAERIEKLYSGAKISMPSRFSFGPFETQPKRRHAGLAHSPHAAAIVAAARAAAAAVDTAVVARYAKPEYEHDGGISCQLPSPSLALLDAEAGYYFYSFDQSHAPQGWKDFVHACTPHMPPER